MNRPTANTKNSSAQMPEQLKESTQTASTESAAYIEKTHSNIGEILQNNGTLDKMESEANQESDTRQKFLEEVFYLLDSENFSSESLFEKTAEYIAGTWDTEVLREIIDRDNFPENLKGALIMTAADSL